MVDRLRACQRSSPANKKCADCLERGPTYICLNFQTFVCQTCSGVHREFGHKIKSITLSEWSLWEVEGVEAGGNYTATQKWLQNWDMEAYPEPDGTDVDKVRDFLRRKYHERVWQVQNPRNVRPPPETHMLTTGTPTADGHSATVTPRPLQSTTVQSAVAYTDLLSDGELNVLGPPLRGTADSTPVLSGCEWAADFAPDARTDAPEVGSNSLSSSFVAVGNCFMEQCFCTTNEPQTIDGLEPPKPTCALSASQQQVAEALDVKAWCTVVAEPDPPQQQQLEPEQLTQPVHKETVMHFHNQVRHMSSQELLQIHGLIAQALQAREEPKSEAAVRGRTPFAELLEETSRDASAAMEFGDLLPFFHARNPIAGFDI